MVWKKDITSKEKQDAVKCELWKWGQVWVEIREQSKKRFKKNVLDSKEEK